MFTHCSSIFDVIICIGLPFAMFHLSSNFRFRYPNISIHCLIFFSLVPAYLLTFYPWFVLRLPFSPLYVLVSFFVVPSFSSHIIPFEFMEVFPHYSISIPAIIDVFSFSVKLLLFILFACFRDYLNFLLSIFIPILVSSSFYRTDRALFATRSILFGWCQVEPTTIDTDQLLFLSFFRLFTVIDFSILTFDPCSMRNAFCRPHLFPSFLSFVATHEFF